MNIERGILISFLGNYLINTVIAAFAALIPAGTSGGFLTPQYIVFVIAALIVVAILTWWQMKAATRGWKSGLVFGVIGFIVSIVTVFVTGICGVLAQTGSFSSVGGILPNFWPFLWNWPTLILLCYWVIPAVIVGAVLKPKRMAPKPSVGSVSASSGM